MSTRRSRPRPVTPFRQLPTGPGAFLLGTSEEIAAFEPVIRRAGMSVYRHLIDPTTLDVETVVLDEELTTRVESAALALILLDVSGDDRLPILSFVDESLPPGRPLLASCTQAGATEQAAVCQHRERVVGIGPLGVLSGRNVIEVAPGLNTEARVIEQTDQFLTGGGLKVYQVGDAPGLVLARILAPIVNEAVFALTEGLATAEAIDNAMQLGANYPFGPLRWADEVGIDRILLAMEYMVQATYEERYRPAPLLRRMAQAGFTGRAAGRGFFRYEQEQPRGPRLSNVRR